MQASVETSNGKKWVKPILVKLNFASQANGGNATDFTEHGHRFTPPGYNSYINTQVKGPVS